MSGRPTSALLLIAGNLVAPVVITGYVGLTILLYFPLLGLRKIFPRHAIPPIPRRDRNARLYPRIARPWVAAAR